jgi:RNA polymerase sigma-70 factor (ECF subfamily)
MYRGKELSQQEQRDLIRRAKECDSSAFASIYECYYEDIYNFIYHRVTSIPVAEDLAAEVFLKALDSIASFTFRGVPLKVWLFRIARNLIADYFRRGPGLAEVPLSLEEGAIAPEAGADDVFERKLTQQQLVRALSSLSEDQQEVVILRFVDGLPPADVAQIMGKSKGSIHSLQHRALSSLNRFLEEFFVERDFDEG